MFLSMMAMADGLCLLGQKQRGVDWYRYGTDAGGFQPEAPRKKTGKQADDRQSYVCRHFLSGPAA